MRNMYHWKPKSRGLKRRENNRIRTSLTTFWLDNERSLPPFVFIFHLQDVADAWKRFLSFQNFFLFLAPKGCHKAFCIHFHYLSIHLLFMRHFGDYKVHTTSQLFPITRAYLFPQYKMSHGKVTFTKKFTVVFLVYTAQQSVTFWVFWQEVF